MFFGEEQLLKVRFFRTNEGIFESNIMLEVKISELKVDFEI